MESSILPQSLLLLPPIPEPATYPAVKAAYHASLLVALRSLRAASSGRTILDIALPCPHLLVDSTTPRSALYTLTQEAVANTYKLICIVAAHERIDVANVDEGAIDARVILLAYPRDGSAKGGIEGDTNVATLGPVVGIRALARSKRAWQNVFSVETEQGEQILKSFISFAGSTRYNIQKIRGGIVQVNRPAEISPARKGQYHHSVAVGGTFDHLHIGHKLLLTMTAFALDPPNGLSIDAQEQKENVLIVGMTAADLLAKKKYVDELQSWKTRTEITHDFLRGILYFSPDAERSERKEEINNSGPNGHAVLVHVGSVGGGLLLKYVEIWDPCGPTITDADIDTLVLSGETRTGGKMVNDKRRELGMRQLEVFEVDVLDAEETEGTKSVALEESFQSKLSSTEIRKALAEKVKGRSKV